MQGGKRWLVTPMVRDQTVEALDKSLIQWLESHVFHPAAAIPS